MIVQTARYNYRGPDRIDITRKSAPPEYEPFAPPGRLLGWGLKMRRQGDAMLAKAKGTGRPRVVQEAEAWQTWAWIAYAARYEEAMRSSYKNCRSRWDALLARERAVLVCFCTDPERCHRRLLAELLQKLGAEDAGELELAKNGEPIS